MSIDSMADPPWDEYDRTVAIAATGDIQSAQHRLLQLRAVVSESRLLAHVENDLGVLAVQAGEAEAALEFFARALRQCPEWKVPQQNLDCFKPKESAIDVSTSTSARRRVAIVSLLFNWPSTGGGTVHTAEAARFLARAGYDVKHISV